MVKFYFFFLTIDYKFKRINNIFNDIDLGYYNKSI
jgi:hypothetical protein